MPKLKSATTSQMKCFKLTLSLLDDHGFILSGHVTGGDERYRFESHVSRQELDALLTALNRDYFRYTPDLAERGRQLFDWLEHHSGGRLSQLCAQHDVSLVVSGEQQQYQLLHLPWELLHDGQQFLCENSLHLFTPLRQVRQEPAIEWETSDRVLGILFMASSPDDGGNVLRFEQEEAQILQVTAKKPLDLQVEESGSLAGLSERLGEYRDGDEPDVIHLTGHAALDRTRQQPVFLLEDEYGQQAVTSPQELVRSLRDDAGYLPALLFLSGCETAQADHERGIQSFSEQVAKAGVPMVLGWAAPVLDTAASFAAAVLYEKLAHGFCVDMAVAVTRRKLLEEGYRDWHLLRCHVDGGFQPLVSKGTKQVRQRNTQQAFLMHGAAARSGFRYVHENFVGRRRLLQRRLRSLRSRLGNEHYAEGVLLAGMWWTARGAAARLVEFRTHQPVVVIRCLDRNPFVAELGVVPAGCAVLVE
ncbi:MAG: CHAT domain-containing protein [Thiolinea sp.]